jgi:hypothetical protein
MRCQAISRAGHAAWGTVLTEIVPGLTTQGMERFPAGAANHVCPNYDVVTEKRPAASRRTVRKGCAFPLRENTNEPHPRRGLARIRFTLTVGISQNRRALCRRWC